MEMVVLLDEGVVEMMVAKGGRRSFSPCSLETKRKKRGRRKMNGEREGGGIYSKRSNDYKFDFGMPK